MLDNEAYTGAVVWGTNAKDGQPPVRVEDAHPAIISKRVKRLLGSRAPKKVNPRRASSPYLLSGLLRCETCGRAMSASEAKSGKYTYYVCNSLLKRGSGTCKTPRLNAENFEKLIVGNMDERQSTRKTEVLVGGGSEEFRVGNEAEASGQLIWYVGGRLHPEDRPRVGLWPSQQFLLPADVFIQSFPSIPTVGPRQHVAIGLGNLVRELTVPAHVSAYGEVPCRRAAETG